MSRCPRCDACMSMWDAPVCSRCAYPEADKRDAVMIAIDDQDYRERMDKEDDYSIQLIYWTMLVLFNL